MELPTSTLEGFESLKEVTSCQVSALGYSVATVVGIATEGVNITVRGQLVDVDDVACDAPRGVELDATAGLELIGVLIAGPRPIDRVLFRDLAHMTS